MAQKEIEQFEGEWNKLIKDEPSFQDAINKLEKHSEGLIPELKKVYRIVNKKGNIMQLADQILKKYEKALQYGKIKEIDQESRFISYDNGTVIDTKTNMMWAEQDNDYDINWLKAKSYCEDYRGGDYTDWRMPTISELAELYNRKVNYKAIQTDYNVHLTKLIKLTSGCVWSSETLNLRSFRYFFSSLGGKDISSKMTSTGIRALPVRSYDLEK